MSSFLLQLEISLAIKFIIKKECSKIQNCLAVSAVKQQFKLACLLTCFDSIKDHVQKNTLSKYILFIMLSSMMLT